MLITSEHILAVAIFFMICLGIIISAALNLIVIRIAMILPPIRALVRWIMSRAMDE